MLQLLDPVLAAQIRHFMLPHIVFAEVASSGNTHKVLLAFANTPRGFEGGQYIQIHLVGERWQVQPGIDAETMIVLVQLPLPSPYLLPPDLSTALRASAPVLENEAALKQKQEEIRSEGLAMLKQAA